MPQWFKRAGFHVSDDSDEEENQPPPRRRRMISQPRHAIQGPMTSTPSARRSRYQRALHPPIPRTRDVTAPPIGRQPISSTSGARSMVYAPHEENIQPGIFSHDNQDEEEWILSFEKQLSKRFAILEKVCIHDMLLLIRVLASRSEEQGKSPNEGLRASRRGAWFETEFVQVGQKIGEGTYGEVFIMRTVRGKRYVIKRETISEFSFKSDLKRILSEKNSMMIATGNPNLIHIKGSWMTGSGDDLLVYTAMEYADFGTLKNYMSKCRGEMYEIRYMVSLRAYKSTLTKLLKNISSTIRQQESIDEVKLFGFRNVLIRFSRELLNGICFLHSKGIRHNDLHDENVLIGSGFHIKLTDFGLSTLNHPLYDSGLFDPDESINLDMERQDYRLSQFSTSTRRISDHCCLLNLLLLLATGIDNDQVIVQRRASKPHFFEPWTCIFLGDEFLIGFGEIILDMKEMSPTEPWSMQIQQTLEYFCSTRGAKYMKFDPRQYIVQLYGADDYTENLTSRLEVIGNEGHDFFVTDTLHVPNFRLAGVGYLDESFVREQEE